MRDHRHGLPDAALTTSAPAGHRWYGCFVLLDDGVADEHLLLRQMRLFLRSRETFADEAPSVSATQERSGVYGNAARAATPGR